MALAALGFSAPGPPDLLAHVRTGGPTEPAWYVLLLILMPS